MAIVVRKWLPPALIAAALVASGIAYGRVPPVVTLQLDWLLPFDTPNENESMPRWLFLLLLPVVALVMWIGFRWAPTRSGERFARRIFRVRPDVAASPAQFERFGKTYDAIVLGVVMLILSFHAALLTAALDAAAIAERIMPVVFGASMIWIGNVMPRLRPNWVAGIRTGRTLNDPQLWHTTHRAFGAAFVASGVATLAAAIFAPRYGLLIAIAALVLSCVVGFIAATRGSGTAARAAVLSVGLLWASARLSAQNPITPVELTAPATVAESAFAFERAGLALHGTLAMPRAAHGKIPVVLIVAGSGPMDRNANDPLMNSNAYAMLARAWQSRGSQACDSTNAALARAHRTLAIRRLSRSMTTSPTLRRL